MTDSPSSESMFLRFSRLCLHFMLVVAPFLTAGPFLNGTRLGLPLVDTALPKLVAVQLFVFAGLVSWGIAVIRGEASVRWHRAGWIGVAFVAWVALSAALGSSLAVGIFGEYGRLQGLQATLTYFAAFLLVINAVTSSSHVRNLMRTLVVAASALSVLGLLQSSGLDLLVWPTGSFDTHMASATFGNPDVFAAYLVAPLAISLALLFSAESGAETSLYGVSSALIAGALIGTFVRGGWIGALVAVVVLAILLHRGGARTTGLQWAWIVGAFAVVLLVAGLSLQSTSAESNALQRITSAFDFKTGSVGSRMLVWRAAASAIADDPLTGEGPDQFVGAYARHEDPAVFPLSGTLVVADNAHDVPLHLAVTLGVPGAALWLAFVAFAMWATRSVWGARSLGGRVVFAGIAAGLLGYLVYLLSGLEQTMGATLMWVLLGCLVTPIASTVGERANRSAGWTIAVVSSVLLLGFATHGITRIYAETISASATATNPAPYVLADELERAITLAPWEPEYRRARADAFKDVVNMGQGTGLSTDAAAAAKLGAAEIREAERLSPSDFRIQTTASALYSAASQLVSPDYATRAVSAARRGVELRPSSPAGHGQLAMALSIAGDHAGAIQAAQRAVALWPAYTDSRITLALIYQQAGETEKARAEFELVLAGLPASDQRVPAIQDALMQLQGAGQPGGK